MPGPLRTRAIVLRRTNVGETDRILNLLTPEGQKSVKAKGVRKEKSRLAGGIEMFSVSDVVIHEGKGELGILTSAKMLKFYGNILTEIGRLELASKILKLVDKATRQIDSSEFFSITEQTFAAINDGYNLDLVEAWFLFNLAKTAGMDLNLLRDQAGEKLVAERNYHWDNLDAVLVPDEDGKIIAEHIKLMRLMLAAPFSTIAKVQDTAKLLPEILYIARSWYN